jgi:hypothetical protein
MRRPTHKAVVSRSQNVSDPIAVSKVADERQRSQKWEDHLRKPFVAECGNGSNAEEFE